jgi:hypothetical protein
VQVFVVAAVVCLTLAVLVQAAALVWLMLRMEQGERARREADHRFALGIVERAVSKSAVDVAQADAIRQESAREDMLRAAAVAAMEEDIERQRALGHFGDEAVARAAMARAGLDPDDEDQVRWWNLRSEGAVQ